MSSFFISNFATEHFLSFFNHFMSQISQFILIIHVRVPASTDQRLELYLLVNASGTICQYFSKRCQIILLKNYIRTVSKVFQITSRTFSWKNIILNVILKIVIHATNDRIYICMSITSFSLFHFFLSLFFLYNLINHNYFLTGVIVILYFSNGHRPFYSSQ